MKYEELKAEIQREREKLGSLAEVARQLYQKYNTGESQEAFKKSLYRLFRKDKPKKKKAPVKKSQAQKFELSAWTKEGKIMSLEQFIEHHGLPKEHIKESRLCTHTKVPTWNIAWKSVQEVQRQQDLTQEFIDQAIAKLARPRVVSFPEVKPSCFTLRIIITDTHIAMETNATGYGLYGGVWNEKVLKERGEALVQEVVALAAIYGSFEEIHVIDLGDYMDGWDGMTVRKGHSLPQNMDNKKAFEVGLDFKVWLLHSLVELNVASRIRCYFVCNDNHSGDFGYIVNHAVKKHIEMLYPEIIQVNNLRHFMSHYTYGRHCFILTHGKDDKNIKFGFKVIQDTQAEKKIREYIQFHGLEKYYVTFEKGDSHQQLLDSCTSDDWDYNNYMALSPASEWIQTNFRKGRSGFNLQLLDKNKKGIMTMPYYFTWKKVA